MRLDDRTTDAQSQPQTFGFGRVKRLEQSLYRFWRVSTAGVFDADTDVTIVGHRDRDRQLPFNLGHILELLKGVANQVQNHLLNLDSIPQDRTQVRSRRHDDPHSQRLGIASHQADDFLHRVPNIESRSFNRMTANHRAQALDNLTRAVCLLDGLVQIVEHIRVGIPFRSERVAAGLQVSDDGRQRLIEFVSQPRSHLPQRVQS